MEGTLADEAMARIFGVAKPLIGVVHLLALPGSPAFDRTAGMRPIVEAAKHDALVCQEAGVGAIIFCNQGDLPYRVEVTTEETTASTGVEGCRRGSPIVARFTEAASTPLPQG